MTASGSDIIKLLPDNVANQIAAGEVIQRPASALKELLENAIDADSTKIQVIIKDAGKSLVQVVDNGLGMSETDARMSFERYATSKLREANDLQNLNSKGFRGEALASIAAIAQVEMKTRIGSRDAGVQIIIEGGVVKSQKDIACNVGTSISVKNLFYNTPARRNFLKTDPVETRHLLEEFHRIAIAHPELHLTLHHNNQELYHLAPSNLRQRLVGIFGKNFNERLVPVSEETSIVNISGFIGKPEFARKTRGEQYFFVNRRFIKDAYLHHAVSKAFSQNLSGGTFPSYFIFLEIEPKHIDINIHPTKTEIKFDDERSIYSIIRAAVTTSLGKFSISPSLDFDKDPNLELTVNELKKPVVLPEISVNKDFNPFTTSSTGSHQTKKTINQDWKKLYEGLPEIKTSVDIESTLLDKIETETEEFQTQIMQINDGMALEIMPDALLVYNLQLSHQRILFEKNLSLHNNRDKSIQQELYPVTYECNAKDAILLNELLNDLNDIGFDIKPFGKNTFIVHGIPNYIKNNQAVRTLENIIEQFKNNAGKEHISNYEHVCKIAAKVSALKPNSLLSYLQLKNLILDLKNCKNPKLSPFGKPTFFRLSISEIEAHFNSKL